MMKQHVVLYRWDKSGEDTVFTILTAQKELCVHLVHALSDIPGHAQACSVILECDTLDSKHLQEAAFLMDSSFPILIVCRSMRVESCPVSVLLKPDVYTAVFERQLLVYIKVLAYRHADTVKREGAPSRQLIGIGASTGGPHALYEILKRMPAAVCGIIVVQHMAQANIAGFVRYLNDLCSLEVVIAKEQDLVRNGRVYIAAGDRHLIVQRKQDGYRLHIEYGEKVNCVRPSIDVLFSSLAKQAASQAAGVLLTGMGNDGAQGLLEMRQAGAFTIIQDEETSDLYGMPKEAKRLQAQCRELPLSEIADCLLRRFGSDAKQ